MNSNELINNPKDLNNAADLYKDLAAGDPYALKMFEGLDLDLNAIKTALNFIVQRDGLTEQEKANLIKDSWRINFRDKPPTPEEFLTEKYLGPTAKTIYPRIRDVFLQFMDPTQRARNLVLYPHISWGKDQTLDSKIYTSKSEYKLLKDIKPGDKIFSPDGSQTEVVATIDWKENEVYELEMEDGKKIKTGPHHLHHVSYRKNEKGNKIWEEVETQFIIDHPELDFEFQEVEVV